MAPCNTKPDRRLTPRKRGASLLGYGLMVGLISVVALGAITEVGSSVDDLMGTTASSLSGAGGSSAPTAPSGPDELPDALGLADASGVDVDTVITSAIAQITGIDTSVNVSLSGASGAEYRICGASDCSDAPTGWTSSGSSADAGEYVQLRLPSSSSGGTALTATLSLGELDTDWTVTTGTCTAADQSLTTSGSSTVNVPAGCSSALVKIWGAGGGRRQGTGPVGGAGALVIATVSVTPGENLTAVVGARGANGGQYAGGGGGGGSALLRGATPLMVAGGGGGGSYSTGGNGGNPIGGDAGNHATNQGGHGATQSAAGTGGSGLSGGVNGATGSGSNGGVGGNTCGGSGSGAFGGNGNGNGGRAGSFSTRGGSGGGGGGGYFGGGGGGSACVVTTGGSGGGGGSSYAGHVDVSNASMYAGSGGAGASDPDRIGTSGDSMSDGQITLQWAP